MFTNAEYLKIAVVGLGNVLLRDDGFGVHVIRDLQKDLPENVVAVEIGTRALAAQELLERVDVVIAIDAVRADGPPGSIYRFDAEDIEATQTCSLHDLGIIGVLRLTPEESRPKVIVLGVEPDVIDYGTELSPVVQAALGQTVRMARRIVEEIRQAGMSCVNTDSVCAKDNK